ncbi:putative MFS family arabinose efflux permease [Paenibacillus shirakamiensis]|uniref:MFS family arabinose efflux permease n=1 Tax=Paenibacillus shirakamiensis TaxID=1265935 RepID=A0ABS4JID8_9BACL|nr:MFS transporter [Paenibacillus shirakamiensis]MBP2001463.1 putative MFS family arabinose efflux permease [Paenibacillus shirakamiensis]
MRKIWVLTLGMFSLGLDAYVVAGLLPFMGASYGRADAQMGMAVSVFTLCYALAAPIFATVLAGRPVRQMLLWALIIFAAANGASAMAPSFSLFLLARACAGIGAGLFSPLASAAAAGLVPKEKRGFALGFLLGGMSMGTVIGVPIGLLVAKYVEWQGVIWMVTMLGVIALLAIIIGFPNVPATAPPSLRQRLEMLKSGPVAATVGVTLVISIASLGLYTYVASILQSLGGNNVSVSSYLWAWGIGGAVGSFAIGPLMDRIGQPRKILLGILCILFLAMLALPMAFGTPLITFIPFLLWGASGWASQAPQQHILLQLKPQAGASVVALNSSFNYLGSALGSTLGGAVLALGLSPSKLSFGAASLIMFAIAGQLLIIRMQKKPQPLDIGKSF